jgi:MFS transporter, SP family, arabinose:H+ symporter
LILRWAQSDAFWIQSFGFDQYAWRWMLGLETLPAVLYFVFLFFVPESPRWLIMQKRVAESLVIFSKFGGEVEAQKQVAEAQNAIERDKNKEQASFKELFQPTMRFVLIIGVGVAVLQQITGINSVFFYAPMIFEQSGIGTDASFVQAILVGLVNLVFTVVAILVVDKLGRKPLLAIGMAGIALSMFLLTYGFGSATYLLDETSISMLPEALKSVDFGSLVNQTFLSDTEFKTAIATNLGSLGQEYESQLITAAIKMNPSLILIGILGFVASFAISIGPVMWVLFSELFPMRIKGLAISFAGFINSGISFIVQLVFPWELTTFGNSITFFIYGLFAAAGLIFVMTIVPETKGKSLEELEQTLMRKSIK